MKIKLESDIHIEFRPEYKPILEGIDLYVIAGDCGEEPRGLKWALSLLDEYQDLQIIYVLGNHTFYGKYSNVDTALLKLKNLVKDQPRLHLLENESVIVGDTKFIGSILWTDFNNRNESDLRNAWGRLNDYKYIKQYETYSKFTPYRAYMLHKKAVDYIFTELEREPDVKSILVTHHQPFVGHFHYDDIWSAFEANLEKEFNSCKNLPLYCFSGHTHNSKTVINRYNRKNLIFISNQIGYPKEDTGFNKDFILEI